MAPMIRRARGFLLRLVRHRVLGAAVGFGALALAMWMELEGRGPWWMDGLALVVGATGAAVAWAALTGRRGDWVEPR